MYHVRFIVYPLVPLRRANRVLSCSSFTTANMSSDRQWSFERDETIEIVYRFCDRWCWIGWILFVSMKLCLMVIFNRYKQTKCYLKSIVSFECYADNKNIRELLACLLGYLWFCWNNFNVWQTFCWTFVSSYLR